MCDPSAMYITNVEKEGVFLKFWGQIDKKAALDVELALFKAYVMYEEGKHVISPANLQIGVLCCAKYIDEKYYRARITNDETRCHGTVEVNFIDFGNRDIVPIANLRSIECFNATFINLPSLALPFILSEVVCVGGEWNDITLETISRQVRYMEVNYAVVSTHLGYKIIKIYLVQKDLASHLVRNNLMQSISLEKQESFLSEMIPRTPQVMPPADQSLLQYKSVTLEPNSQHEVYVSYITDGPCHFSVQLKKSEGILAQLMREINSIPLKTFEELPIPGTVCLAKCIEDSHICRAVITSEVDNQYKLFYVDFGNTEIVPPDNIYQMPFKYIIPKIMAIRLSLEGIDKSTVTLEMQCAFKQFVDNRLLRMEVFPSAKKMCLPKCRMWDPEANTDVLEILNKAAQLAFPNVIPLHRGFTRPIKVTFVYSCNKFYIHLKSNEEELNHLMANIQVYCNSNSAAFLEDPKVGQPCCAQFAHDGQWYRSSVVAINEDNIKVKYIDYGNEEDVPMQSLKKIEGVFLTCMRPQAIECCLNGYQNMTEDIERDNKLEELTLDQEFTMKVIDIVGGKSLVDLLDSRGCSVTTLLMEAMVVQTKVQIVSNDNENNTKKYSSDRNDGKAHNEDKWLPRDNSQNRKDKSEDWRKNSRKRNGSMSNESAESWRHANNKNDSEWHDNTSNENFRKGRKSSESRKFPSTNPRSDGKYRNNRVEFRSQNNNWNPQEQDDNNPQSFLDCQENDYSSNNQSEWNGREANRGRNRFSKQENEGFGHKETGFNRNKNKNFDESYNTNNSMKAFGDDEEFQGVKKKTRTFNGNNSYNRSRPDNETGNKKNGYSGNEYTEKKTYREKNSYDSDNSYKKGKQDRSYEGKPKYNDRGDNKRKPFRKDNEFHSSDYEQTDGRKFNSRSESKWTDKNNVKSFNNSCNETKAIDAAPDDAEFPSQNVTGRQKVTMSWFHNPCSFFCQLIDSQQSFSTLMEEIQEDYKDKASSYCVAGAPAIALFPEDNVFYRSKILKNVGNQYKVYYVDFGNISVVDKVWPIDKKYIQLPMQAIPCGLGGIQPVGNDWPDPIAFTNYMQKDCLDCEFQRYEIDRYMVNLYSDNEDIKQQLVKDDLAKYVEPSVPSTDFDINYLSGHTFRAMIDHVNSLSNFTISLNSGIQLMCSAHNLDQATERYEDELKQREGQVMVVYCDNIIENRLQVTLYDHVGTKLNILNPDEGAYESIEPVCPHLLVQPKVEGYVCYANETSIVIQPSECAERLQGLLNELYEHYQSVVQETPIIPEEGFLYAVCSEDANWYRGRVVSFNDEKVTVMYVDYGNTEDVLFSSLRELDPKYYWWDRMAIMVHVNVPTVDLCEKQVVAKIHYSELGLEGEILEVESTYAPEEVQLPEIANINQEFNTNCRIIGEAQEKPEASLPESDKHVEPQNVSSDIVVEGTAVVVSHIDSPSDFYIQLADSQNAIGEIQSKLQERIGEMVVLENTSIGGLCAAPYSVDQMWYRSQILDADEDITTVRFIDYGNTDVIDNKTTQIKTLPAEFLALEEYATRCRLKIKPLEDDWSKATCDRFEQLVYAESVKVQFVNQDEKANHVEIFSDGRNVKDVLLAENLAVLDEELGLDPKLKGYISHMNSPSEFWVQLDGWCAELEWIAEQLSNVSSFPDLEDFTPGSLCAAMFPDDEMWYRARILSNTVAGLEVLFLDYGNSCVCSNLKQLPEHLVMAPPLALKCSLQKPEGLLNWSPEAARKFSDLSADGQTEFTVKKLTTGETSIVELYVKDEGVSSKLLPTTDDVCVTDINSMDSFAVSKQGVVSDERYRLEKIPGFEYNQESLKKFEEINNEGKTLYGMEYLSDNTARLYIGGNDIRKEFLSVLKKCVQPPENTTENLQYNTESLEKAPKLNSGVPESREEVCDASQTEEGLEDEHKIHEPTQDEYSEVYNNAEGQKINEVSQHEDYKVLDTPPLEEDHEVYKNPEGQRINEVSQTEVLNISPLEKCPEVTQEQDHGVCNYREEQKLNEVSEEEASETNKIAKEEEIPEASPHETSEVCDMEHVEILEVSQEETHEFDDTPKLEEYQGRRCETTDMKNEFQEKPTEGCDTPNTKEIHELVGELTEELCDLKYVERSSEVTQEETHEFDDTPKLEENQGRMCETTEMKNEFREEPTEECDTPNTKEIHELVGELTEELCGLKYVEKSSEVSQEEIHEFEDTPKLEENQGRMCETTEMKNEFREEPTEGCDTPNTKEIHELARELTEELCDLTYVEKSSEVSQEETYEFCDNQINQDKTYEKQSESNETTEMKNEFPEETPEVCDTPYIKEIHELVQELTDAISDLKHVEESFEVSQEETLELSVTPKVDENQDVAHEKIFENNEIIEMQNKFPEEPNSKETHELTDLEHVEESLQASLEKANGVCKTQVEENHTENNDTKETKHESRKEPIEVFQESSEVHEEVSMHCNKTEPKEETEKNCDIPAMEIVEENIKVCDKLHEMLQKEKTMKIDEESSDTCDKPRMETEKCDMLEHSTQTEINEGTKVQKIPSKIEFTDKMMTSFSVPTVSEKESKPKLSPTRVTPKSRDTVTNDDAKSEE